MTRNANNEPNRGELIRAYPGGPVGRWVGMLKGTKWVDYQNTPASFRQMCQDFDDLARK